MTPEGGLGHTSQFQTWSRLGLPSPHPEDSWEGAFELQLPQGCGASHAWPLKSALPPPMHHGSWPSNCGGRLCYRQHLDLGLHHRSGAGQYSLPRVPKSLLLMGAEPVDAEAGPSWRSGLHLQLYCGHNTGRCSSLKSAPEHTSSSPEWNPSVFTQEPFRSGLLTVSPSNHILKALTQGHPYLMLTMLLVNQPKPPGTPSLPFLHSQSFKHGSSSLF